MSSWVVFLFFSYHYENEKAKTIRSNLGCFLWKQNNVKIYCLRIEMGGLFGKPKHPHGLSSSSPDYWSRNGHSSFDNRNSAGRYMVTPFVLKRWRVPNQVRRSTMPEILLQNILIEYNWDSSMYIDEDGDVAHEFYVESRRTSGVKSAAKLRKVDQKILRPQGYVNYEIPRLHQDLPYIMVETTCFNSV